MNHRALAFWLAVVAAIWAADNAEAKLASVPFGYHDEFRGKGGALLGAPMTGSGASFARLHISPSSLGYPGSVPAPEDHWPQIDLALDTARQYGRGLLLSIYDRKAVAATPEFTSFVATVLEHADNRGVKVIGLEVWNEPNITAFGMLSPDRVVALAREALAGREQVGSSVPIIAGGLFAGASGEWLSYLRAIRDLSGDWLELAVHPYAFGRHGLVGALADMRKADRIAGERGLWVTEAGFAGYLGSEQLQRHNGVRLYNEARRLGCRGFVWYRLLDSPGDQFYGYGTLRVDGSAKPLFTAIGEGSR